MSDEPVEAAFLSPNALAKFATNPNHYAPCFIEDVFSAREGVSGETVLDPCWCVFANSWLLRTDMDIWWIGMVPVRMVEIVGIVVGVSEYESRATVIGVSSSRFIVKSHI